MGSFFEGVYEIFSIPLKNQLAILANNLLIDYSFIFSDIEFVIISVIISEFKRNPRSTIVYINLDTFSKKTGRDINTIKNYLFLLYKKGIINIQEDIDNGLESAYDIRQLLVLMFFLMEINKFVNNTELTELVTNAIRTEDDEFLFIRIIKEMERRGFNIDYYMELYFNLDDIITTTYNNNDSDYDIDMCNF